METTHFVKKTHHYTIFSHLKGNRPINKLHVRRLRESFKKKYLISPIIVNELYQVIDGQHRLEAAKELGLPVYFVEVPDYNLQDVQIFNANMLNWSKMDYLNGYCDLGYPEYLKFRNFMRKFPEFQLRACEGLLTNRATSVRSKTISDLTGINKSNKHAVKYFENGDLVIPDYDLSVKNAEMIMQLKPYYSGFNRSIFVYAMIGLFKNEKYNHETFLQKLKTQSTKMVDCSNVSQYKLLIEEIYNFRNREKISLRF